MPTTTRITLDEALELTRTGDLWLFRGHTLADRAIRVGTNSPVNHVGLSVVLDFPANTLASRRWMRGIVEDADAAHELHFLDVPDETCRRRLRERNAAGGHPFQASDAEYEIFTRYFVPPTPDEGFNVVTHGA